MGAPDGYRGRQLDRGGPWGLGTRHATEDKGAETEGQGGKGSRKKSMQAKDRASAKQRPRFSLLAWVVPGEPLC